MHNSLITAITKKLFKLLRKSKTSKGYDLRNSEADGSAEAPHPVHLSQGGLSPIQKVARENTTLSTMGTHNQTNLFNFSNIWILKIDCFLNTFKLCYQHIQTLSYNKYYCSYYSVDCRGRHCNLLNCRTCCCPAYFRHKFNIFFLKLCIKNVYKD